jgi:pimeloyl-ACP methyl ester carboxylesterase
MESEMLETRLGPLAWQSSGQGPTIVFFAGALANHDLWRDVVTQLHDRYRCVTVDLPLGAHPRPLNAGADRSAASLARLLPECLELLDITDATVVVNDTAGGLLLLSLASGHPALGRISRLVLTNCESYDQFPPDSLKRASELSRRFPGLTRAIMRLQVRLQLRWPAAQRRFSSTVTVNGIDRERAESFFGPAARDPRVAADLVAAMAGFRPQLMLDAAPAIPAFAPPVLLIWGEECRFFTMAQARRLAADFPHATLVSVPGAKAWVPVDNPAAVAGAIAEFVPAQVR